MNAVLAPNLDPGHFAGNYRQKEKKSAGGKTAGTFFIDQLYHSVV